MLSLWRQTLFANPVLCNSIAIYKECDGTIKIIYCLDVESTAYYFTDTVKHLVEYVALPVIESMINSSKVRAFTT